MNLLDEQLDGRVAARQIQGARPYQEDDYGLIDLHDEDRSEVLLLADGMGGHVSGDTASWTIVQTFAKRYSDTEGAVPDRLRTCLDAANQALAAAIAENPGLSGMGSTVVAAVISPDGREWISVGDSPLWLFRKGKLRRLSGMQAEDVAVEAAPEPQQGSAEQADLQSPPSAVRPRGRPLASATGLRPSEWRRGP